MAQTDSMVLACPRCHLPLETQNGDMLHCPADQLTFHQVSGVWHMLLPDRELYYRQFIREYESVRKAEGRGTRSQAFYRALPYRDLTGAWSPDWKIRAASFDAFLEHILLPLEKRPGCMLSVADLGSGNGWLSNRLALRGHSPVAVDLVLNPEDGLGCYNYYTTQFLPVQAEFDALPFRDGSFNLAVFNASFHYSVGFEAPLREARRVVKAGGSIILLDSPIYHDASSGQQMVREREAQFQQRYGFPSNSLPSENFLTYARLENLAAGLKLTLKRITPRYGLGWALRRLRARILGGREPANFHLVTLTSAGDQPKSELKNE
jgi:SAM-dependent methyltransferase